MTKRFAGQLAILVISMSGAAFVQAQDEEHSDYDGRKHRDHGMRHEGPGGRMGNPERMLQMMTKHLDLDETQTQQLNNIMDAARPEIQVLREGLHENREALRSLDPDASDYNVKLERLSAANADLAARMTLLHGRLRADVHDVLTLEQGQALAERSERFRDRQDRRGGEETIR